MSLAAIILSLYFTLIWKPSSKDGIVPRIPACDKILVPEITAENIVIKLTNGTQLSPENFLEALKKYLNEEKALLSAQKSSIKPSLYDFNEHLNRAPAPLMLRTRKGTRKWNKGRNKNSDDEDDVEESGDKELTTTQFPTSEPDRNNDTTIVFDQEID